MVGARPCPVCGRGMFRRKALLRHIRRYHPEYFEKWIMPQPKSLTVEAGGGVKALKQAIISEALRGAKTAKERRQRLQSLRGHIKEIVRERLQKKKGS